MVFVLDIRNATTKLECLELLTRDNELETENSDVQSLLHRHWYKLPVQTSEKNTPEIRYHGVE